jgi:UDP-glucose 4-epimerase
MRILITGGAGFIGSHLVDRLITRGDRVLVIDNFTTGRRDNLTPHSNLSVVDGTIADRKLVNQIFDEFQPEKVIHAAASYKDPQNWEEDARTNVLGTTIIVQASERLNVRRLIYFQTSLCYGLHPIEQPITLNHPIRPEGSSYAISKTAGEEYIRLSSLDFISFRLANAYGPRNLSGPLPTFYHSLTQNKPCFVVETRRDFIYIDDLINVVLMAVDNRGSKGIYHVSSGFDFSIKELFDATVKALNIIPPPDVEVRPRSPDDVFTILLDPSKTKLDFGWEAKSELETGVRSAIEWYKRHGIEQTYTHLKPSERNR